jgi:hypothetical protein
LTGATLHADAAGEPRLAHDAMQCDALRDRLPLLTAAVAPASEDRPAVLLAETLDRAPLLHRLQEILFTNGHLRLTELARQLWDNQDQTAQVATARLLQLAAVARREPRSYPLVPHRLHVLARPASGMAVCLNTDCPVSEEVRLPPFGAVLPGAPEICPNCQKAALPLYRCQNCGTWLIGGELRENRYHPIRSTEAVVEHLTANVTQARRQFSKDKLKVYALGPEGTRGSEGELGIPVAYVERCPQCGTSVNDLSPFGTFSPLPLTILAESALAEMPVYPSATNAFLPASGRRLLAFSDSRQEAARLGPRLTRQHEQQVVRALIHGILGNPLGEEGLQKLRKSRDNFAAMIAEDDSLKPDLEPQLMELERKITAAEVGGDMSSWAARLRQAIFLAELLHAESGEKHTAFQRKDNDRPWGQEEWEANRTEVRKGTLDLLASEFAVLGTRTISLEKVGLAEVTYPGLDGWSVPPAVAGVLSADLNPFWPDFLRALLDTLRIEGAVTLGEEEKDKNAEIAGFPLGAWAIRETDVRGYQLLSFPGASEDHRRRKFSAAVLRQAGLTDEKDREALAKQILEAAFDQLAEAAREGTIPWLQDDPKRQAYDSADKKKEAPRVVTASV